MNIQSNDFLVPEGATVNLNKLPIERLTLKSCKVS
jgi:hypothetical protein